MFRNNAKLLVVEFARAHNKQPHKMSVATFSAQRTFCPKKNVAQISAQIQPKPCPMFIFPKNWPTHFPPKIKVGTNTNNFLYLICFTSVLLPLVRNLAKWLGGTCPRDKFLLDLRNIAFSIKKTYFFPTGIFWSLFFPSAGNSSSQRLEQASLSRGVVLSP